MVGQVLVAEELMVELRDEDPAAFKNFVRMEPASFQELLMRVGPRITKRTTWFREPLEPGLKLAITLRHLATGDSYRTLMYGFRVAHNTICNFVPEVCQVIIDEYAAEVMPFPTTPNSGRDLQISLVLDGICTMPLEPWMVSMLLWDVLRKLGAFFTTTRDSTPSSSSPW